MPNYGTPYRTASGISDKRHLQQACHFHKSEWSKATSFFDIQRSMFDVQFFSLSYLSPR